MLRAKGVEVSLGQLGGPPGYPRRNNAERIPYGGVARIRCRVLALQRATTGGRRVSAVRHSGFDFYLLSLVRTVLLAGIGYATLKFETIGLLLSSVLYSNFSVSAIILYER